MSVLDLDRSKWTYILDVIFGDNWELRRLFVERWLS